MAKGKKVSWNVCRREEDGSIRIVFSYDTKRAAEAGMALMNGMWRETMDFLQLKTAEKDYFCLYNDSELVDLSEP